MILKELATVFDTIFYKNLALDRDKTGLRVGNIRKDIRKILVTLDLTDNVIKEAIRAKVDLLLSHHPLLMEPIDSFSKGWWDKSKSTFALIASLMTLSVKSSVTNNVIKEAIRAKVDLLLSHHPLLMEPNQL